MAIDTQTALVLALYFDIVPEPFKERTAKRLKEMLEENGMHLNTGFVGTAYLCKALTKAGLSGEAYTLLFKEDSRAGCTKRIWAQPLSGKDGIRCCPTEK